MASSAAGPRRGARVLLVEDDLLSQEVALGMLAPLGLRVTIACDGTEALRLVNSERFDLVLMDIRMPVMDGLAATRAIRAIPECADLPIIAMSANIQPEDRRQSREAGMNDHLSKPIEPEQLKRELLRWLPADGDGESASLDSPQPFPEPARNHHGVIDVAIGLQFFGGRQDAYLRMLRRFMSVRAEDAVLIEEAIASGDMEQAGRLAHSLKSMSATLGAEPLRVASAHLERMSSEGDPTAVRDAAFALRETLQTTCEAIATMTTAADQPRSAG